VRTDELERVAPRLVGFTAQMLEGLPRSDQRAKGELYVRGLLTDGARKSMQPMAARLGVDHQRLQQFITSSTWDYELVRANVARWAVDVIDPDAYVIDDTGFPKDGTASPCVARQYSGTLGKTANCQIAVSVQVVSDAASVAGNWRLFCPASWDDTTISDPQRVAVVRERRARAGIPDQVRHREKWRLALDMLDQMLDEWRLPRRPVVADSGYGDATLFRLGLAERGLPYVMQVDPTATAQPGDAVAITAAYTGRGRPPKPAYPDPPVTFKHLMLSTAGRSRVRQVTWRHGTRATRGNRQAKMRSHFLAIRRMAPRPVRTGQVLAVQPRPPHGSENPGPAGEDPLADRTRLPRTQNRPRHRPLRRPQLHRLAPPRHPHRARPSLLHPAPPGPKSGCAGLTLYAVLRLLQRLLVVMTGACHVCNRPFDDPPPPNDTT
jgi:SRSO17 transposase